MLSITGVCSVQISLNVYGPLLDEGHHGVWPLTSDALGILKTVVGLPVGIQVYGTCAHYLSVWECVSYLCSDDCWLPDRSRQQQPAGLL